MFSSTVLLPVFFSFMMVPATLAQQLPAADISDSWFDGTKGELPPQTGAGELLFLDPPPAGGVLHSQNKLIISQNSLVSGWVELRQCYRGLDPVPDAQVIYRYKEMRGLRIQSLNNIGQASVQGNSVQLVDVQREASLCIAAAARILYPDSEAGFVLRTGPFHRKFLDGYFPFHVTLDIRYPSDLLRYVDTVPAVQAGFQVQQENGHIHIDSWFAGQLAIEVRLARN